MTRITDVPGGPRGARRCQADNLDNKDGEAAQYLSADTSSTGLDVIHRKKLSAEQKQAYIGQMAYWTPCMSEDERTQTGCPGGYHEILVGHGKTFDSDSFEQSTGCHSSQNRLLCLNNEILEDNCVWNRQSDGSKICDQSCPDNTIFLTQNTLPAGDKTDYAHGSFIAVCCNDLQVLTSVCKNQYSTDYIFSGGLSGTGGSDFYFTRGGLKERSLSARGTHLKARAEGVKSGIKKDHPDETTDKTVDERKKKKKRAQDGYNNSNPCDSRFEYDSPQTPKNLGSIAVYTDEIILGTGKAQATRGAVHTRVPVTSTRLPDSVTRAAAYTQKTCPGERYPQVCANWKSVALNYNLETIACPDTVANYNVVRFAPKLWYDTHHKDWGSYIEKSVYAPYVNKDVDARCQSDEWPPFDIWGSRNLGYAGIYVRHLPGDQNGGASSWGESEIKFEKDCGQYPIPWTSSTESLGLEVGVYTDTIWEQMHYTRTITSIVMKLRNIPVIPGDPKLLTANVCWPKALLPNVEPDFALNWYDRIYGGQGAIMVPQYKFVPAPAITQGIPKPTRKRSVEVLVHPDDTVAYVVDAGNSTRPATSEEIAEGLGIDACLDMHCTQEKEKLHNDVVGHRKRQVYLNEHKGEINSILAAGMPLQELKSFETGSSEMVLSDSSVAPPVPTETHSGATVHSPVVTVTVTETAPPIIEGRHHGHMKAHMRKKEHAKQNGVQ